MFPNVTITVARTDNPGGTGDFNPVACVGHFTNTGTYVLTGGTGAYLGISGGGTYSTWGTVISAYASSGCGKTPIAVFGVGRPGAPLAKLPGAVRQAARLLRPEHPFGHMLWAHHKDGPPGCTSPVS